MNVSLLQIWFSESSNALNNSQFGLIKNFVQMEVFRFEEIYL